MHTDILEFRGVRAWLQDPDGQRLPLSVPPVIHGNQITASIALAIHAKKKFHLSWCTAPGTPSLNAWCQVFRSSRHGETTRATNHYMSSEDIETQSGSTRRQLELPLPRHAWLSTPYWPDGNRQYRAHKGSISLEIRRLCKPPHEREYQDVDKPGTVIYEADLDIPDDDASKDPFVVFRFDFKPGPVGEVFLFQIDHPARLRAVMLDEFPVPPGLSLQIPLGRQLEESDSGEDIIPRKKDSRRRYIKELRKTNQLKHGELEKLVEQAAEETNELERQIDTEQKEAERIERDTKRVKAALQDEDESDDN
ncbi:hypothetical protein C8R43DRAFT_959169 [Mycena crocata]|nr:hypothetical protein C8R43DRAFT_959169 [Mycena crocata]